jgi:hypothetical protein
VKEVLFCTQCQAEKRKSEVEVHVPVLVQGFVRTFYAEDGHLHVHNSSFTKHDYTCANNHRWTVSEYCRCWCGWSRETQEIP